MSIQPDEDAAVHATLEQMKGVPCCAKPEAGCLGPDADCCCSCPLCLCGYTAFQVEQGDVLLSPYVPKLGYAIVVEIGGSDDQLEAGDIVALLAPGKVWFPETRAGWLSVLDLHVTQRT